MLADRDFAVVLVLVLPNRREGQHFKCSIIGSRVNMRVRQLPSARPCGVPHKRTFLRRKHQQTLDCPSSSPRLPRGNTARLYTPRACIVDIRRNMIGSHQMRSARSRVCEEASRIVSHCSEKRNSGGSVLILLSPSSLNGSLRCSRAA